MRSSFANLGQRIYRAARDHGSDFIKDIKEDLRSSNLKFDRVVQSAQKHGTGLREDLEEEVLRWVE